MEKYLEEELKLNYLDLCKFLQDKYGMPKGDYFLTESCKSKNTKITRGNEGLFLHHINENTHIQLSKLEYAVKAPFNYQKAENLCYCNYLEHMILHMKIVEEYLTLENSQKYACLPGIGGLINFIVPEINDYMNGYQYQREWQIKAFSLVDKQSFEELKASLYNTLLSKEKNKEIYMTEDDKDRWDLELKHGVGRMTIGDLK